MFFTIQSQKLWKNLFFHRITNNPSPRFNGGSSICALASAHNPCLRFLCPHHLKPLNYHDSAYACSSSVFSVLNSCHSLKKLKQTHALIITSIDQERVFGIASKLAFLYIRFNDFRSSVSALKVMEEPDSFIWNSVIKAHVNSGLSESAASVFKLMRKMGVRCDGHTFPIMSKLLQLLECGDFAKMIHCVAMKMGFRFNVYFCNTMMEAYVKVGCFENALNVFDEMPVRDLVSWTSMISGYVYEGEANGAFGLFIEMRKQVKPNEVTLIVVAQACSDVVELTQIHGYVIKLGSLVDLSLKNSILKMYALFDCLDDSEILFQEPSLRDVVSWNTMVHQYSSKRITLKLVDSFNKMRFEVNPSIETFALIISGLLGGSCENNSLATQLHSLSLKSGIFDDVLTSRLLDLYANSGYFKEATALFKQVLAANIKPDTENLRSISIASTHLGTLRLGKAIHGYFIRNHPHFPDKNAPSLETSILNAYIKSGDIHSARICFEKMLVKDLVAWSSMIEGYGTHGLGSEALEIFSRMIDQKTPPNSITFLSLLSACSHSGLLHQGCRALNSMKPNFNIEPSIDHYTCIVDLLARSGKTKEALSIILRRVALADSKIWAALLSAARVHGDRKMGGYAARKVLELESDNPGYYTLFSNVQAGSEKWDEVQRVRGVMRDMNLNKNPGWSCVEVRGVFHGFVSGDRSHCEGDEIYAMVEFLSRNAFEIGNSGDYIGFV